MTKLQEHYKKIKTAALERRMIAANVPVRFASDSDVDEALPRVIMEWLNAMLTGETFLSDTCQSYLLTSAETNSADLMPSIAAVLVRCDLAPFYTTGARLARALLTDSPDAAEFLQACRDADILIIDYCFIGEIWRDVNGEQRVYLADFIQEFVQSGGTVITQGGFHPEHVPVHVGGIINAYFELV